MGGGIFYVYGRDLPAVEPLASYQPPTLTRIYSPEGRIIDEYAEQRRIYIPFDEIPDLVKNAFISAEDKNFYEHAGFDLRGIAAALYEAVESRGESVRGASTIPQQVAKIIFFGAELALTWGRAGRATGDRIAGLFTVAVQTVVAQRIAGAVHAGIRQFVA